MEMRSCARCSTVMDRVTIEATEVDRCPTCGAIWLDLGELGSLVNAPAEKVSELVLGGGDQASPPLHAAIRLDCPACKGSLATLEFDGQRVDRCEGCHGLLFDKNGLQKGVASLKAEWSKRHG